jgi:aminoglycoside phosphotransferase family enzyme
MKSETSGTGADIRSSAQPVTLADKVRFLNRPESYPENPAAVELRETHMSYVFLTPTQAFKMKKPIANGWVDLRTLEARDANSRSEVQLNRRLAPNVYLGVVALTESGSGSLALGGEGRVVEWLVHMHRLPATAMLDHLILHGLLRPADIEAVAGRLGDFFAAQASVEVGIDRYIGQLRQQLETSMKLLARPQFGLPDATVQTVHVALVRFIDDGTDLAARVQAHRIVDGHGDLRPEHVCVRVPPVVIDCLEFSRELRLLDPFDEIAFLALECARLGAPWVGPMLRQSVQARLDDHPPARLIAFYTALRACIRARLAMAHLLEPEPRTPSRWLPLARDYLARAEREGAALD